MRLSNTAYWSIVGFILISSLLLYLAHGDILNAWKVSGLILLPIVLFIGYMMLSNHMIENMESRYQYPLRPDQCYVLKDSDRPMSCVVHKKLCEFPINKGGKVYYQCHRCLLMHHKEHHPPVRETRYYTGVDGTKQN